MDPAGIYEISMSTAGNGDQTHRLNFAAGDFPGTLQIANLDQAQYVKPATPFTLYWTSPDGAANDLMHLVVLDGNAKVFETPAVRNAAGSVNGSARWIIIPGNTLTSGKTYTASLRIFRPQITDTFSYPGATGVAGYSRLVRFPIKTASGPTPQPFLELPRRINNQTELRFSSIRGETYRIQSSTNVASWNNAHTITASDATTIWLSPSSSTPGEFFRIIAGP
jgi:hypothetical protein